MKLLLLCCICALLSGQAMATVLPSYAVTILEYNDIAQSYIWQWIVYGVEVLGPGAAICNWLLPTLYSLFPVVTATQSGQAQFDACMKGIYQFRQFWYFGGLQRNQVRDFSV
jgi:Na+/citrate or Na+/malate symporter